MNTLRIIFKSISSPLQVIKTGKVEDKLRGSIILMLLNTLLLTIIMPVVYYCYFKNIYSITLEAVKLVIIFCISLAITVISCLSFLFVSVVFKKNIQFKEITAFWGLSYIPNIVCTILYTLTELFNYVLIGNSLAGFIINTVFIMLLIWKAIFYFIQMNFVLKLSGFEFITASIAVGIVFIALIFAGSSAGIQIPPL